MTDYELVFWQNNKHVVKSTKEKTILVKMWRELSLLLLSLAPSLPLYTNKEVSDIISYNPQLRGIEKFLWMD